MEVIKTKFNGLLIIRPRIFPDQRGYFFEVFNHNEFLKFGIDFSPVQDNESKSVKGVIRGLHYQLAPFAQSKLIRVVDGRIYDVSVDLRKASPTFGKCFGIEINSDTKDNILIPAGFAHGFSVLSETAVIQYKCDNFYSPQSERGISPVDPSLGIDWHLGRPDYIISDKDMRHPNMADAEYNF